MKKFLWSLFGVGALLVSAQMAKTAPITASDSQTFTVTVPKRVSITAPNAGVTRTLPNSSATLAFPNQVWQVKRNVLHGVGVTFVVQQPFTNTTDSTYKRDAGLTVAVASGSSTGPATWTVAGTGSAQTDYAAAVPVTTATVSASSDKVGQAAFNVGVSFLTVDINNVAEGSYVTTVVGTVTENP